MSQNKYLIDTNLFIDYFRGVPKVVDFFNSLNKSQITFSTISYLEFVKGEVVVGRTKMSSVISDTFQQFAMEAFTHEMALYAGQKALKLRRKDMNDLAIAATALKLKRTLVTLNIKDFAGFAGLRVKTVDELLE